LEYLRKHKKGFRKLLSNKMTPQKRSRKFRFRFLVREVEEWKREISQDRVRRERLRK